MQSKLWIFIVVRLAPVGRILAALKGVLILAFAREENAYLFENLQAAFPHKTHRELRALCRDFWIATKQASVDQLRLEHLSSQQRERTITEVELRGQEHLEKAYAEGRPVILVTPHYGNFMLGALKVAHDYAKGGVYFFYNPPEKNPYAQKSDELLNRPDINCHKIYNNPHGIKTALKVLRGGGTLCMMPDLISVTTSTIYVPFFGKFFAAIAGIGFLALRSNAAVIPAYCYSSDGGGHVLEFRPPIELPSEPGQSFDDQVYHLTSGLFAELERQISKLPQHWRYWHIYKKRAIHFVTPPLDTPELVSQLKGLDALICQDEGLVDAVKQWIQMAEHPQPASDTSNLGSQHA